MNGAPVLTLPPATHAHGTVRLPGSKSISNRALLLAALAQGTTELAGVLDSDDTRVMVRALRTLGVAIDSPGAARDTVGEVVRVSGAWPWPVTQAALHLGNAGTALRPLTAVLAVHGGHYELSGVARMHERPVGDLVEALQALGAAVQYVGQPGFPPLSIAPGHLALDGPLHVRASVSSQFLTALLMAAPLVAQQLQQDVVIALDGELISQPYIAITLALMARFGVHVQRDGWRQFHIARDARYRSPGRLLVEGDASSASYFLGLGAIAGGPLRLQGVGRDSIQGDLAFAEFVEGLGAQVRREEGALTVSGVVVAQGARLRAFDVDFTAMPDAAMTAAVLALYADGPCTLRGIASWRVKETDRIAAMHAELARLGAQVESGDDFLRVQPMAATAWRRARIQTYQDHRMAMCFSLAAFGPVPVDIDDPGCVAKTYPQYFTDFQRLIS